MINAKGALVLYVVLFAVLVAALARLIPPQPEEGAMAPGAENKEVAELLNPETEFLAIAPDLGAAGVDFGAAAMPDVIYREKLAVLGPPLNLIAAPADWKGVLSNVAKLNPQDIFVAARFVPGEKPPRVVAGFRFASNGRDVRVLAERARLRMNHALGGMGVLDVEPDHHGWLIESLSDKTYGGWCARGFGWCFFSNSEEELMDVLSRFGGTSENLANEPVFAQLAKKLGSFENLVFLRSGKEVINYLSVDVRDNIPWRDTEAMAWDLSFREHVRERFVQAN